MEREAYFDIDPRLWLRISNHAAFTLMMTRRAYLPSTAQFGEAVILCPREDCIQVSVVLFLDGKQPALLRERIYADRPRQELPRGIAPDEARGQRYIDGYGDPDDLELAPLIPAQSPPPADRRFLEPWELDDDWQGGWTEADYRPGCTCYQSQPDAARESSVCTYCGNDPQENDIPGPW